MAAFGHPQPSNLDWLPALDEHAPLAAYARQHDNADAAQRYWLRADPVVMHPDISRVHLLAINNHDLSTEQADQLLNSLQTLFADDGFELSRGSSEGAHERWYVSSSEPLPEGFAPPDAALGNPLEDFLRTNTSSAHKSSADSKLWQRLQSETQMQLHQHPINIERQERGLSALNSLWFWGAGKLQDQAPVKRPDAVLAMSVELAGWCVWAQVQSTQQYFDKSIKPWIDRAMAQDNKIMVEWRIQRRLSLEQNLMNLDAMMNDLSQQKSPISVYQQSNKAHQLINANHWQRWLTSDKKIMTRGIQKLIALSQHE